MTQAPVAARRPQHRMALGLLWLAIMWTPSAAAYLDPGTGALLWQSIVAGLFGLGVAIRLQWKRLVGWFRRDASAAPDDGSP